MINPPSPVLILGARSDIARAIARCYAEAGCSIVLGARNASRLEDDRADLSLRYPVEVKTVEFDVLSRDPDAFFNGLDAVPGTVVMVAGLLGDQTESQQDDGAAQTVMETNYAGPARFLLAAARVMASRTDGACIIGISSVAGDRGRASNFIYGSAKAGFSAFLSGLRASLAKKGIHVMTVKPGFVATAMTQGMKLPPLITASADEVGRAVFLGQQARKDVIYTRSVWRPLMAIIKAIPEPLFKRLSL